MPVIKQSLPKQYMSNVEILLGEDDFKFISSQDLYSGCVNFLVRNNLFDSRFASLFDYFHFKFSKNKNDLSKELKTIYKNNPIEGLDMLLYSKNLISSILKESMSNSINGILEDNVLVCVLFEISSFNVFLLYFYELVFGGKRFVSSDISCKIRDLDDVISLLRKKSKKFTSEIENIMLLAKGYNVSNSKISVKAKVDLDSVEVALFQKIKLKFDYIILQNLARNILPEESVYYSSRFTLESHVIGSLFSELVNNEYDLELTEEFYSLLRKRSYLLPKSGVNITPSKISFTVDIYEKQFNNENYIVLVSNFNTDVSYYTFINLNRNITVNNCPHLYELCNFLYSFYNLEGYAKDMYGDEFSKDPKMVLSFKSNMVVAEGVITIKGRSEVYEDYTVEVPYYWRYRGRERKPSMSKKDFLKSSNDESSCVYISAFKRKLPVGQKASDSAKQLAKFYCIDLDDGETLVSPYIRS